MENQNNTDLAKTVEGILIDFTKICRFCLSQTENGISLDEKCLSEESFNIEQNTVLDFLTKSGFIRVGLNESLYYPSQICESCYNLVKVCYNFRELCNKSDDLLRNHCENHFNKTQKKLTHSEHNSEFTIFNSSNQESNLMGFAKQEKFKEVLKQSASSLDICKQKLNSLWGKIKEVQLKLRPLSIIKDEKPACECTLCFVKFSDSKALSLHLFSAHKQNNLKFQCRNCIKTFSDQGNLREHYKLIHKINENELPYEISNNIEDKNCVCFTCVPSKKFHSQNQLHKHFEELHKKNTLEIISKVYSCDFCSDTSFSTKLSLSDHLLLVHNLKVDKTLLSKQESKPSDSKVLLSLSDSHSKNLTDLSEFLNFLDSVVDSLSVVQDEKGAGFKVFCKNCTPVAEFFSPYDFINHLQTHHKQLQLIKSETKTESPWKCSECHASYTKKQSLYYHMREKHKHTNLSLTKCPEPNCLQSFSTNRQLIRHGISIHRKYFAYFHKVFQKVLQSTNEEEDKRIKNFECDICQKKYTYKTSLKKHILTSHLGNSVKDKVFCSYCGKTLSSRLNLKSHIEFVHEALFVSCPICKKKINFRTIGKHYKTHKNSDMHYSKNSFLCNLCGKILKSRRSFEDHQKLHKNIRNEVCDVCGSGFTTKKILRLHKKTHEGLQRKVFACDQCDKVFSGRHTLNRHLLTHSGKKNFICEICSKCFYTLQELNRHVKYHKKEYKFDCPLCDMRFMDKSRFRHHMMRHRNIRPHKCQFCGKMFIVRGKMNLHLAAKHNFEVPNSKGVWKDPNTYVPLDDLL